MTLTDQRQAVDQAKRLQASWQQVGVTARSVDQKLWRDFRAACDAVFAKKQQQSAEFKEELEANLTRAQALIAELKTLTQSDQALLDMRGQVDTLRQEFNNVGMLPKAKAQEVNADFLQAIDTYEQKILAERQAVKQQVWLNLFAANDLARCCQLALLSTTDSEKAQGLVAETNEKITAINPLPNGGLKALQQKLVVPLVVTDIDENLLALRMLCVRAEVLCGVSTPAADQSLRMAYQVKQLEQNFGQKPGDLKTELESLVFEWVSVGPVETADYEPLFQRFNQCGMALSQ